MLNGLQPHLRPAYLNARIWSRATAHSLPAEAPVCSGPDLTRRDSDVAFWLARGKTNARRSWKVDKEDAAGLMARGGEVELTS